MKRIILTTLFIVLINYLFAQKEYNIWYFGDSAGLDFNSGSPVALTNSAMFALEGCASISDANGNILFYTQGTTIWNKNHTVMPNGTGLKGNVSSTQAALIVPQPGSNSIYYVFTTDQGGYTGPGTQSLRYSIVDMTLQGGLGDVNSTKNSFLMYPSDEKVGGARHSNGQDVWVIAHKWESDSFYTYLVTSSGLNTTPVISKVGTVHAVHNGGNNNTRGYLKVSPKGDKLALAVNSSGYYEIFDFDNSTGVISNAMTIPNYGDAYGIEFSPDGTKLYANKYSAGSKIYQFNLLAGSQTNIINSAVLLGSVTGMVFIEGIQLGPDGKIYVTKVNSTSIGVINNPDALGTACNYVGNSVSLNGRKCEHGFPNFIQFTFASLDFTYQNTCFGDSTLFFITDTAGIDSVSWDFDDPASGSFNKSILFKPFHIFSSPGIYHVKLTSHSNVKTDTVIKQVTIYSAPAADAGADITICEGYDATLTANGGVSYEWNSSETTASITVNPVTATTYTVTVTDTNSCTASDDVIVHIEMKPVAAFNVDTLAFEKQQIQFYDQSINADNWYWTFGDGQTSTNKNPKHGYDVEDTYTVTLIVCSSTITDCCDTITKTMHITKKSIVLIPTTFTPNGDGKNDVLYVKGEGIKTLKMKIFNQWGILLFEATSQTKGWNGTFNNNPQPEGNYIYTIEAYTVDEQNIYQQGTVSLIR